MSNHSEQLVRVENLSLMRGHHIVFDKLNLSVQRGCVTAIMGPSGTGKTTLLKLISAQLKPDQGQVVFDGQDLSKLTRRKLYAVRRRMGMLFQSGALFSDLSVYENVAFPLRTHTDLPESMIRDLVLTKLHAVGLRGAKHLMPNELSGGMARRAALARAIALDPDMIMYDEPFAGQDPISMGVVMRLIRSLNHALGLTTVIVSHDVQETASIADYIYVLANGRIIGEGTPEEVLSSDSLRVKQFMQGLPDGPVPFHYPAKDYPVDLHLRSQQ